MMKIVKPLALSLIQKTYGFSGKNQFSIGIVNFFKMNDGASLISESEGWKKIAPLLQSGIILDMGYVKPQAEVLIAGDACAEGAKPVKKQLVTLKVSGIHKRLQVIGPRSWNGSSSRSISDPEPFTTMPLTYGNSYGGVGFTDNPLGKGYMDKTQSEPYGLPSVFYADDKPVNVKKKSRVAGFTPLDISWPQRSKYNGTYDKKWLDNLHPGFPLDTDPRLFNSAASDQIIKGFFQPGDDYEIIGMHPQRQTIQGKLPELICRAFVCQEWQGQTDFREVETCIDTLWLFPGIETGVVIHRGVLTVNDSDGLDIKTLMLACEHVSDPPRSMDYYKQVMSLRTDPKTAIAHMMNEGQLMPQKNPQQQAEIKQYYDEAKQELKDRQQALRDYYNQQLQEQYGLEVPEEELPGIEFPMDPIPQKVIDSGDMDLSHFIEQAEQTLARLEQEHEQKMQELEKQQEQFNDMVSGQEPEAETVEELRRRIMQPVYVGVEDLEREAGNNIVDTELGKVLASVSEEDKQAFIAEHGINTELLASHNLTDSAAEIEKLKRKGRQHSLAVQQSTKCFPANGNQMLKQWINELLADNATLAGRDFSGADLRGMDFSGLDMRDCMFEQCQLDSCNFSHCNLQGAVFVAANVDQVCFNHANLKQANFCKAQGHEVLFQQVDLSGAMLIEAQLNRADFTGAVLNHILGNSVDLSDSCLHQVQCLDGVFVAAKLKNTEWFEAQCERSIFFQANFTAANWQQALLSRCVMIDLQAPELNFNQAQLTKVQFSNIGKLSNANLSQGKFNTCGFRNVDLTGCNGEQAVFVECDLSGTGLNESVLTQALFNNCIMMQASLNHSDCSKVLFNQCNLRKATLEKVSLENAEFRNTDLSEVDFVKCKTKNLKQYPMASVA